MSRKNLVAILAFLLFFSSSAVAQDRYDKEERYDKSSNRLSEKRFMGFAPAFAAYGSIMDIGSDPGYGAGGKIEMPLIDILKLEVRGGWLTNVEVGNTNVETDVVPVDVGLALHEPGRIFDRFREDQIRPLILGGGIFLFSSTSRA